MAEYGGDLVASWKTALLNFPLSISSMTFFIVCVIESDALNTLVQKWIYISLHSTPSKTEHCYRGLKYLLLLTCI